MLIRDTLTRSDIDLTPAEAKIAQVLLDEYPTSGLGTATALAKRAGVSDPTVLGGCPSISTFNATQTGRADWMP